MATSSSPKVSCLMVTSAERLEHVRRSVACYIRQSYPERELVIVCDRADGSHRELARAIESLQRPDIRLVLRPERMTLGAKRNLSMDEASGEVLCQWDDDDLCHRDRVRAQLESLRGHGGIEASYLQDHFWFFRGQRELFWASWAATNVRGLPGSAMFLRSLGVRYPEQGARSLRGEDDSVFPAIARATELAIVQGAPFLYVYVHHGSNTWHYEHHYERAMGLGVPRAVLLENREMVTHTLAGLDLGVDEVRVVGPDGPAFTWARSR